MFESVILAALQDGRGASSGWVRLECPACPDRTGKADRRKSMSANATSGRYGCFKCGVKGRLRGFEEASWQTAQPRRLAPKMVPPEGYTPLWEGPGADAISTVPAREYLLRRGVDHALWRQARLGACVSGRCAGRVIVPILSADESTWVGWVGRSWTSHAELPYYYPPGMERQAMLYNEAALGVVSERPVMVVEGAFDAIALWPDAVAVLGKPSRAQVEKLAHAARPVVVVLDGDAWMEGEALAMELRLLGQRAGSVRLPPKTDPDEVALGWLLEEGRRSLG